MTWPDAYRDGGVSFLLWDGLRRSKQHVADALRGAIPLLDGRTPAQLGRRGASLLRGRIAKSRTGTLPIDVLKRVVTEAGPGVERVDLFNYGEPFLYRHLVDALRHVRHTLPKTTMAISTDGLQVSEQVEATILREQGGGLRLLSQTRCDLDAEQGHEPPPSQSMARCTAAAVLRTEE